MATYTGLTPTAFGNSFSSGTSWAFNAAICCTVVKLVKVTVMMLCLQKRKHQVMHRGCRDLYRACASLWRGSLSLKRIREVFNTEPRSQYTLFRSVVKKEWRNLWLEITVKRTETIFAFNTEASLKRILYVSYILTVSSSFVTLWKSNSVLSSILRAMHYSSGAELNRGSALDLKSRARPVLLTVQAVLKPISFSAFLAAAPLLFSKLIYPDHNT